MAKVKRRKNKNTKLIFEIATAVIPIYIIVNLLVSLVIYQSVADAFLNSKQQLLTAQMRRVYKYTDVLKTQWYYDKWESYGPDLRLEFTDNELRDIYNYFEDVGFLYDYTDEGLKVVEDPAAIEYIAGSSYSNLIENLSYDLSEFEPCSAFIITLDEEGNGRVILDLPNYEVDDTRALGDSFKYDMSDHPNLQNALLSHYSGLTFEKTDDFIRSGTYYVVYEPVLVHGKVLCIRGLACKWVEIFVGIIVPFIAATIIGVIGISLMFLVLFLLIYFRVISPIGKIQKNLRKYIFNKNSGDVLSAMKKIKARNEIGRLSDDVVDLAMEMDKYTNDIVRMTGESQRVATELDMAKNIQAGQLPSVFPPFPDRDEFDIYASMTPAKEVGGDFYDFFLIDDDHLALVMADVSGKGVPAALFMMMSKMLIHNYATMGLTPHEVVEKTNDTICENNPEKMFVTVWFGILEISTGKITACNAGHEYPVVSKIEGRYELFKDKHGFVVGGIGGKKYKEYEFTLDKGETLFVYTDGVPEATNAHNELYGTDRLIEAMNSAYGATPEELLTIVHEDVNRFVGEAPQFDDLTMMALRINSNGKEEA